VKRTLEKGRGRVNRKRSNVNLYWITSAEDHPLTRVVLAKTSPPSPPHPNRDARSGTPVSSAPFVNPNQFCPNLVAPISVECPEAVNHHVLSPMRH
jgi:hypothetical protein